MKGLTYLLFMLRLSGVWPAENHDKYYLHKQFLRLIILTYCGIGLIWYTIELLKDPKSELVELLEAIFVNVCYLNLTYSYLISFLMRERWMKELERLTNFDNFGQPMNLAQVYKILNMGCLLFFVYMVVGMTSMQMYELLFVRSCREKYHKLDRDVLCGFLFKLHYHYNITNGVLWYLHIIIPVFTTYTLIGGATFVVVVITAAEMIIVRIDHLNTMILEIFNARAQFEQRLKFRVCCIYHQYIIQLHDDLTALYLPLMCPMLLNYSIVIGLQLLSLNEEISPKPFINLLGWIGGTFLVCYCSQRLADKSISIAATIYDVPWYEADVKLRRDLLFMMMRAQMPAYLTVGLLGWLSNDTFKVIMKGSYTYATLRKNV